MDVDPAPNSHGASRDSEVSLIYDQAIDVASVTANTLVVHRKQTDQWLAPSSTFRLDGEKVSIRSEHPLKPGEVVQVTATKNITGVDNAEAAGPFVWQFRAQTEGGTGWFADTGQRLGNANSSAVALGDLDGDGDLDAFVANDGVANAVWRNNGRGRFVSSRQQLGHSRSRDVALGDLDGDGDLDAYVVNTGYDVQVSPADRIWLNDGSGTFRDSGQRLGDLFGTAVALGDLNGDGSLDAVVRVYDAEQAYRLWLNNGDGRMVEAGSLPHIRGGLTSRSVALGDLDGDGDTDVMSGDKIWMNNGKAEFVGTLFFPLGVPGTYDYFQYLEVASNAIALGDMDGDGDLDAFVGWSGPQSPSPINNVLLMNDGHGRFRDSGLNLGVAASSVGLGDVDGDGDLDFVTDSGTGPEPNQVWINRGEADWFDVRTGPGFSLDSIALGDLDHDGDLDAFIAYDSHNGDAAPNHVWLNADVAADLAVTLNDDQMTTAPGQRITYTVTVTNDGSGTVHGASVSATVATQLVDVRWSCVAGRDSHCTASGRGDIQDTVTLAAGGGLTYTITGTVDPAAVVSAVSTVAMVSAPDGLQDRVWSNNMAVDTDRLLPVDVEPRINWHSASTETTIVADFRQAVDVSTVSDQTFTVHGYQSAKRITPEDALVVEDSVVSVVPASPFFPGELVEVAVTSRISRMDVEASEQSMVWQFRTAAAGGSGHFNDSGQRLVSPDQKGVDESVDQPDVVLGDLDGDGDLDVVVSDDSEAIWLNNGGGQFIQQPTGVRLVGSVALADIDGDGDLDIVSPTVWLNEGDGRQFRRSVDLREGDWWSLRAMAVGDLDGDGHLDVFGDSVWLNRPESPGTFQTVQSGLGFTAVTLGDLDADGDLDALAIPYRDDHAQVWINNGRGKLSERGQLIAHDPSVDVALGDVDGDGDLDALVATRNRSARGQSHAAIWLNDGRGRFFNSEQEPAEIGRSSYRDYRVALADIDGDGDLDAVLGISSVEDGFTSWTNDGEGRFTPTGGRFGGDPLALGGHKGAIAVGDVDGDADLDIVVARPQATTVWHNADVGADLSISASNGQSGATPGQPVTYQVVVANHGSDSVVDATVTDTFPSQLVDVAWTCAATAGSTCTQGGIGNIADTVSLLSGGRAIYTANGTVEATVDEILTNTAAIMVADGRADIDLQNDRSIDVDIVSRLWADPSVNSHSSSADSVISADIAFVDNIVPQTVLPDSFVLHATQTGQLSVPAEALSVEGRTVTLFPGPSLHAGDLVQVTAKGGIRSESGETLEPSVVWQYHVGTSVSSGTYAETGVRRGRAEFSDLNGDGHVDAVFEDSRGDQIWLNDGAGSLFDSGRRLGIAGGKVLLGDLDGDGDVDAFVSGYGPPTSYTHAVWLNDGQGNLDLGWEHTWDDRTGPGDARLLGDFDGDGDLDVLPTHPKVGGFWVNDGNAEFTLGQPFGSTDLSPLTAGDLDGDGDLDLLGALTGWGYRHLRIWLNDGNGRFEESAHRFEDFPSGARSGYTLPPPIRSVELGDLDGDGDLDVFIGKQSSEIWLNDGDGVFRPKRRELPTPDIQDVALGDVDGDGDLDAFVGNGYYESLDGDWHSRDDQVWLNDGHGLFHESGQRLEGGQTVLVKLFDVDGDGDLDAFTQSVLGDPGSSIWINQILGDVNADGQFNRDDIIQVLQAGRYQSRRADWEEGDWNGDGRFDQHDIVFALQADNYR